MKQLLMIAILVIAGFSANAQRFHNDSQCDLEFREVCIDVTGAPGGCTITGTGGWISAPAMTHVTLTPTGCTPPDELAYEVRYAASTGCTASVIIKGTPTICTTYPQFAQLPGCSPCNPNGLNVHANPHNVHVDPM
jgi:hypothetical protein